MGKITMEGNYKNNPSNFNLNVNIPHEFSNVTDNSA